MASTKYKYRTTPDEMGEAQAAKWREAKGNLRFIWENTEGFWAWWEMLAPLLFPLLWRLLLVATVIKVWWR